ncbi:MAG: PepSY domain-containing protein [Methylococcales bacterium]|nr:PepSY domain-containing protein [Methylococcales bacterium]
MLAVFILLISLSGGILVFKEPILRRIHPVLAQPIIKNQKQAYPKILTQLEQLFQKPKITFLRFPQKGMNAFHLWLSDGSQAFVAPLSGKIITRWSQNESVINIIFLIHTRLLAGDIGKIIVGCIGLSILFFLMSGLLLWWPRRRLFRFKHLVLRSTSLIQYHITIGVVFTPFILLFVVTGTTKVFYRPVTEMVTMLLDPVNPKQPDLIVDQKQQVHKSWSEILKNLNKALPDGDIKSWSPSKPNNAAYIFRKRMPEEWNPYGRTFIVLNPYNAQVIQIIDAREHQDGMKIMEKIYPLHASKVGGLFFKTISVISAIFLFLLTMLGISNFFIRRIR